MQSAKEAHDSAQRAYDSAVAAGKDAKDAAAAANEAYEAYESAKGLEIAKCHTEYAMGPAQDIEKLLAGTQGDWYRNCVANVIADPNELAQRAYTNASYCSIYPDGSDLYKNCINAVLAPDFTGTQTLVMLTELIKGVMAVLIPAAAALAAGCVITVVCGAVAGTLLTIGDVGLNIYKYINGDQSLADTLLHLGTTALETLAFVGLAKIIGAGFRFAKELYNISRAAKQAEADLKAANDARRELRLTSCVTGNSFSADTPVLLADGRSTPIADVRVGDRVLSTDPATGVTVGQPVTSLISDTDTVLTDVTVKPDTGAAVVIHTTPHHPFWTADARRWIDAAQLPVGGALRTPDGGSALVTTVRTHPGRQVMHNLTVAETHTYYVTGGAATVLVHNVGGCLDGELEYDVTDPTTGNAITDIDSIENGELWELKSGIPWWEDEAWLSKQIDAKFQAYLDARKILPAEYRDAVIGFRFTDPRIDPKTRAVITARLQKLADQAGVQLKIEFAG